VLDPEKTVADEVFETDHHSAQLIRDYEELLHNPAKDSESFTKLMVDLDEHQIRDYQSKVDTILAKLQLQDLLSQQIKTLS
jgi:ABC transporter, ATP-binding protein